MLYIVIFLYGLLVGSFLNAWIWRTYTGRKISRGRSVCPHCKHQLAWYDLIPLVSWLALRARCRYCKRPISAQYPLVELGNAVLWVAIVGAINPTTLDGYFTTLIWLMVSSLLVAAFVFDLKWMLLPDQFMVPAIVLAAIWLLTQWLVFGRAELAWQQLMGAVLFAGAFFALWYASRGKWLGDGDIRLALLMGLLLTPSQLVIAIFVSFNLGAVVGITMLVTGRAKRSSPMAFGPFLIIGLFTGFFYGQALINWYLNFLA
ncbi:MAG: prepilin peptidase [Candidatus Saccharibacteria bacterium]|jgi:prepilin signal peptidase PulO-like enzyme (type II secretory pathway)